MNILDYTVFHTIRYDLLKNKMYAWVHKVDKQYYTENVSFHYSDYRNEYGIFMTVDKCHTNYYVAHMIFIMFLWLTDITRLLLPMTTIT